MVWRGAYCPVPVCKWVNGRGGAWGVQMRGGKGKGVVRPDVIESTKQICTKIYYICSKTQVLGLPGSRKPGKQEKPDKT
jgi:hypothetical protein